MKEESALSQVNAMRLQQIAELRAEVERLAHLVEVEPVQFDMEGGENCGYCGDGGGGLDEPFVHTADCLWVIAKGEQDG